MYLVHRLLGYGLAERAGRFMTASREHRQRSISFLVYSLVLMVLGSLTQVVATMLVSAEAQRHHALVLAAVVIVGLCVIIAPLFVMLLFKSNYNFQR